MAKSVLGRGIGALIEMEEVSTAGSSTLGEIEIAKIKPNPGQPRTNFDAESLQDLSASIKELGVIQPITVRLMDDGSYQIIAGERRYRASKLAGLRSIPAYIKTAQDEAVMKMALIENLHRDDLDAIEIALSFKKLVDEFKVTQEQLSELVGKKRATVANYLRLLKLPAEIQSGITHGVIEMGHAKALISIKDVESQLGLYHEMIANDYNVRKVEERAREIMEGNGTQTKKAKPAEISSPAEYNDYKAKLVELFQTRVELAHTGNGKGKITIPFASGDELAKIMDIVEKNL